MILNQGAYYLLAFATIGALLASSLFIINNDGALTQSAIAVKKIAIRLTSLWFITAFLSVLFTISEILNSPLADSLDGATINSFLIQTSLGKSMFYQLILIAVVLATLIL